MYLLFSSNEAVANSVPMRSMAVKARSSSWLMAWVCPGMGGYSSQCRRDKEAGDGKNERMASQRGRHGRFFGV